MSEHEERVAKNEAVFREVNERIRDITSYEDVIEFLCECGDRSCLAPIPMSAGEYEHVRSDATWFFVVPGHAIGDVEVVIEMEARFHVVRKRVGVPAAIADTTDPRD